MSNEGCASSQILSVCSAVAISALVIFGLSGLSACSTDTAVHYKRLSRSHQFATPMTGIGGLDDIKVGQADAKVPKTVNPSDPAADEFVFALSASSIAFGSPKKDEPSLRSNCDGGPSDADDPWPWVRCWKDLGPVVTPHASRDYVFAGRASAGMRIAVNSDDPLLVRSVTVNWSDPTKTGITRMGGNLAVGWGLAGPYGGLAALIFGEISRSARTEDLTVSSVGASHSPDIDAFSALVRMRYLCGVSSTSEATNPGNGAAKLLLPVAIDVDDVASIGSDARCWHQFPKSDRSYSNAGWLYRTVYGSIGGQMETSLAPIPRALAEARAFGRAPPIYDESLSSDAKDALGLDELTSTSVALPADSIAYFPVSACRTAVLEITWWQSAADAAVGGDAALTQKLDPTQAIRFAVEIADPRYIQKMRISHESRTISVRSCGAVASASPNPPTNDGSYDEFLNQVKAVRKAQQDWDSSH